MLFISTFFMQMPFTFDNIMIMWRAEIWADGDGHSPLEGSAAQSFYTVNRPYALRCSQTTDKDK